MANGFLALFFAGYAVKFTYVLGICVLRFRRAPSIAYTLSDDGISSAKKRWLVSWEQVYDAADLPLGDGLYIRKTKKNGYSINNWGIDPAEMKKAKRFIRERLSQSKTKRLS